MELVRSSVSIAGGLPPVTVRSAPAIVFSRPAQRSLTLRPARSPSRHATLCTESSDRFVTSAAASIATGWSEPVPGRELHPLKSSLSRRTVRPTTWRRRRLHSRRVGVLAFGAEAVALVLDTRCTVGVCKSPLLQAPDEFGRDAGFTELLCRLPYLPATDIPVRAWWSVSVPVRPKR